RVDALVDAELSHEADDPARSEAERALRLAGVDGKERLGIDAQRDRLDALGRGAARDDPLRLVAGVRDVAVAFLDGAMDARAVEAPAVLRVEPADEDARPAGAMGAAERIVHVHERERRRGDDVGGKTADRARE